MEKQIISPKLRFPEFIEGWKNKRLDEFAPLQRGFDLPVDNIIIGEFPVVFSNGILKHHNEFKVKAPGVVTGRSGTIGKVTYVETDFWPHNTSLWVTNFKGNYPLFVYFFYLRYNLERFGTGSGVPTLNRNDIHLQKEYFPNLPEQTKIANFLIVVDSKLTQLKKKKSLLEQYKKGVMQKLFSQELRFKDENGADFAEWEEKKLGEVATSISSGKSKIRNLSGEFPLYGSTGIIGKTDQFEYDGENILIARVGANAGLLYKVEGNYSVTDNTLIVSLNKKVNADFVYYFLIRENLNKLVFGSGQPLITGGQLKKIYFLLPTLLEQTQIANFLSAIDDKINHCTVQIEKMEMWKKGLLQQMFV